MRGPGLIAGYLDALAGQLPGPVVVIGSVRTPAAGEGMVTA